MSELKISLAAARINAGFTQEQIANRLKVSKVTIVNWEKGKAMPTFATVNALSEIYGIPICNIFLPSKAT